MAHSPFHKLTPIALGCGAILVAGLLAPMTACEPSRGEALSSPAQPVYNFVGIRVGVDPKTVEGIRAVISWSVEPSTSPESSQSTWIGLYSEPTTPDHVSFEIVQIGWKQAGKNQIRLFWEWGISRVDFHVLYGPVVDSSQPIEVEIDRLGTNGYTFVVAGAEVGRATVPWKPSLAAANAETHNPADSIAGSAHSPEILRDVAVKVSTEWHHLGGRTFSTDPNLVASLGQPGEIEIWDARKA